MARTALKRTRQIAIRSEPVSLLPGYIPPALATKAGRPMSGGQWVHEVKFDGFRSQLHLCNGTAKIFSRAGHDWTERYDSIADDARKLNARSVVLDGEMVVLRPDGTCDFWALQKDVRGSVSERLTYMAFDILFHEGNDVRKLPLLDRKNVLRKVLGSRCERIGYVEHVEGDGDTALNLEGIVSKRVNSPYRSARGDDWIKTPCQYREMLLVAGIAFDEGEFDGLYLARRVNGELVYAGFVEDGFEQEVVTALLARLTPLGVKRQPVVTSSPKKGAKWVQPVLTAHIRHRGGLTGVRVRRPVFESLVDPGSKARPRGLISSIRENVMRELTDALVPSPSELKAHSREVAENAAALTITPTQSANSGVAGLPILPVYTAGGGLYSYGGATQLKYWWSRAWATHAFVKYERLAGDAGNSPLVLQRGDANQWTFGAGVSYSLIRSTCRGCGRPT